MLYTNIYIHIWYILCWLYY